MAIIYFLQSEVVETLLKNEVRVVLLTDDDIIEPITRQFGKPGLTIEGLRLPRANHYYKKVEHRTQWLMGYLRRVGGSWRVNNQAQDSHIHEVWKENSNKFRLGVLVPAYFATLILRTFSVARKAFVKYQMKFTPGLYSDLLDKYQPDLIIASTPGWRIDRYLLREAIQKNIDTMTMIVGWDNPSSYAIPGAPVKWANCWSAEQKRELVEGSDWPAEQVHIGGIPSYDGYFQKKWLMPKDVYFDLHGLDKNKKLISYACSFVHFAPNYPNIEAMAELIAGSQLNADCQLLIRLHPSHFQDKPEIFSDERHRIFDLEAKYPFIHVVRPKALGGSLGYYGGEDMDEKSSMMAHSDIFVTVYSTMVVETAVHNTPIIAAVIDTPGGWNVEGKYSLALKDIGDWPTHQRFRWSKAGRIAADAGQLREAINLYLENPSLDQHEREEFLRNEITFTDSSAGVRTGQFILDVLNQQSANTTRE